MKVDMVVMRHANPGAAFIKNVKHIINAGDSAHEHPTQVTR
jgi:aspartate carbamoyltransferase catalytic subunit